MKILAVVVLYNPDINIANNIFSYMKFVDSVLLIDNSDNNENKGNIIFEEIQKNNNQKSYYYKLDKNEGIAYALNRGFEFANNIKCDFVLTMDQDSSFGNNIIDVYKEYLHAYKKEKVILCPSYYTNRSCTHSSNLYEDVDMSMQSANLIKVTDFMHIGPYREEFFIDVVDYEYCIRAKRMGYSIIRCNNAILYHNPAETCRLLFLKYGKASPERYYYQIRNLYWTYRKYREKKLMMIIICKYLKVLLLFNNKHHYLCNMNRGIRDSKNNIMGKINQ